MVVKRATGWKSYWLAGLGAAGGVTAVIANSQIREPAAGRMAGRQAGSLHLPGCVVLAFTGLEYVAGPRQLTAHGVVVHQAEARAQIQWPFP